MFQTLQRHSDPPHQPRPDRGGQDVPLLQRQDQRQPGQGGLRTQERDQVLREAQDQPLQTETQTLNQLPQTRELKRCCCQVFSDIEIFFRRRRSVCVVAALV